MPRTRRASVGIIPYVEYDPHAHIYDRFAEAFAKYFGGKRFGEGSQPQL